MALNKSTPRDSRSQDDDDWEDDGGWDQTPRTDRQDDDDGGRYLPRGGSRREFRRKRSADSDSNTPLILALLGWFICGILSFVALVMAINQVNDARSRGEAASGLAIASLIISGLHIFLMLGVLALVFLVR